MSHYHAHTAFALLGQLPKVHRMTESPDLEIASAATAHALLAIEERLGEIAEQQRLGNTIAAFQSRAVRNDADYEQARETVRRLLELPTEEA